jgi:hypothetical protein
MNASKSITVVYHNSLVPFTNTKEISLEVDDYADIVSATFNLFPELDKIRSDKIANNIYEDICLVDGKTVVKNNELTFPVRGDKVNVVPLIQGGQDIIDFLHESQTFNFFGVSFASVDILDYSTPQQRILDSALFGRLEALVDIDYKENFMFTDIQTTTSGRQRVPLHFGLVRIGPQVLNSYVKTLSRNSDDYTITNEIDLS